MSDTTKRLDSDREISESEILEALERPPSFGLSRDHEHYDDMFVTWSLGPILRHRDSSLIEESNADVLLKHLNQDESLSDDWTITRCNHWAYGWVEHLSFRVLEEDKNTPTRIFRVLMEWYDALKDYPIADETDYYQREYQQTIVNICDAAKYLRYPHELRNDLPSDWAEQVFSWLTEHQPSAIEDKDGNGGWPPDDVLVECLTILGYLDNVDSPSSSSSSLN